MRHLDASSKEYEDAAQNVRLAARCRASTSQVWRVSGEFRVSFGQRENLQAGVLYYSGLLAERFSRQTRLTSITFAVPRCWRGRIPRLPRLPTGPRTQRIFGIPCRLVALSRNPDQPN